MSMSERVDTVLGWVSVAILVFVGVVKGCTAQAEELRLLEPTYLSLESWKTEHMHDPYIDMAKPYDTTGAEEWAYGASFKMNANLMRFGKYSIFTRNDISMQATDRQVRKVSWEWDNGFKRDNVELFYHHHSQHVLDMEATQAYPLTDEFGVRLIFLDKGA